MKIRETDVVLLADGREATVIDVLEPDVAYLVEVSTPDGSSKYDDFAVRYEDIQKVVWTAFGK